MNRIRTNKQKNFTVLCNIINRDKNISTKTKGVYFVIMSLPEDWDLSISGLASILKEGKYAIRSAIKELEANGYLNRIPVQRGWDYDLYETPSENPLWDESKSHSCKNHTCENYTCGNHTQLNNLLNKENKEIKKESKANALPKKRISLKEVDFENLNKSDAQKIIKKIKEECLSSKEDDLFNQCWKLYERKGSKSLSLKKWEKLTSEEHKAILKHIPYYNQSRPDKKHRKDFQSYINLKTFEDVVIFENRTLYDPELFKKETSKVDNSSLDDYQDEYTDDTRPHLIERPDGKHWHKELRKWTYEI